MPLCCHCISGYGQLADKKMTSAMHGCEDCRTDAQLRELLNE